MIKYYGDPESFTELLNSAFGSPLESGHVGSAFRYTCQFEGKRYCLNLFNSTGSVQIQPSPPDALYNKVKNALANNTETFITKLSTKDMVNKIGEAYGKADFVDRLSDLADSDPLRFMAALKIYQLHGMGLRAMLC